MKSYVLTLLAASISAAVIQLVAPKGEGGRLGEHVRMIAGLFLLVILLQPVQEGIALLRSVSEGEVTDSLRDGFPSDGGGDYEAVFNESLSHVGREEARAWVFTMLEADFGVPPSGCDVSVVCTAEEGQLTVDEVRIALPRDYASQNPHPIESRVTQALGCPCYVTVELFDS